MSADTRPTPIPHTLDYGRRSRLSRVAKYVKVVLLVLLILAAVVLFRRRDALLAHGAWHYRTYRAASFRMPADIELVVDDPKRAQELLTNNRDYVPSVDSASVAVYSPLVYRQLREVDPRTMLNTFFAEAIAFIGNRKRPDGTERLVIIKGPRREAIVLPVPAWRDPLPTSLPPAQIVEEKAYDSSRATELRGGAADPKDPTHLIFKFVVAGPKWREWHVPEDEVVASGVIDAYLRNDDSIRFVTRDSPELRREFVKIDRAQKADLATLQKDAVDFGIAAKRKLIDIAKQPR